MIKFRVFTWVATADIEEEHYGIQIRTSPTTRWRHAVKGDQVVLYATKLAAMRVCRDLRLKAEAEELKL